MKNTKFSIIVTTNRGTKELNPLFTNGDSESELIIADSNYNEETKKYLERKIGKYESIVYVPILDSNTNFNRDFNRGLNTALSYAENDWIVKADDNLEFKSDFFEAARDDINVFKDTYGNQKFIIIGNKLWGIKKEEKWQNYAKTQGQRYIEVTNPLLTFSFGIMPIDLIYILNGYSEIYDAGWGFDDSDFLYRLLIAGFKANFDTELMGYSYPHKPKQYSFSINKVIYDIQKLEISLGKVHAFNPYIIRNLQNQALAVKEDYILD